MEGIVEAEWVAGGGAVGEGSGKVTEDEAEGRSRLQLCWIWLDRLFKTKKGKIGQLLCCCTRSFLLADVYARERCCVRRVMHACESLGAGSRYSARAPGPQDPRAWGAVTYSGACQVATIPPIELGALCEQRHPTHRHTEPSTAVFPTLTDARPRSKVPSQRGKVTDGGPHICHQQCVAPPSKPSAPAYNAPSGVFALIRAGASPLRCCRCRRPPPPVPSLPLPPPAPQPPPRVAGACRPPHRPVPVVPEHPSMPARPPTRPAPQCISAGSV